MILRVGPSGNDQSDAVGIDKVNFRKIKQNRCNTARLRRYFAAWQANRGLLGGATPRRRPQAFGPCVEDLSCLSHVINLAPSLASEAMQAAANDVQASAAAAINLYRALRPKALNHPADRTAGHSHLDVGHLRVDPGGGGEPRKGALDEAAQLPQVRARGNQQA